jgi:hypothetical protein
MVMIEFPRLLRGPRLLLSPRQAPAAQSKPASPNVFAVGTAESRCVEQLRRGQFHVLRSRFGPRPAMPSRTCDRIVQSRCLRYKIVAVGYSRFLVTLRSLYECPLGSSPAADASKCTTQEVWVSSNG